MAINRQSLNLGRKNNRKGTNGRVKQVVYSEKRKVLVGRFLSPKGKELLNEGRITEKKAWEKYGRNKYRINPNAQPVKIITHDPVIPAQVENPENV